MGLIQNIRGKLGDSKKEWKNIKENLKTRSRKEKAAFGAAGTIGGIGGAEIGGVAGMVLNQWLAPWLYIVPDYVLPAALGAVGAYYGLKVGIQNFKAGIGLFAAGSLINPLFGQPAKEKEKEIQTHYVPHEIVTLEAKLGETEPIDSNNFSAVKELVKPTDSEFWSAEDVYDLTPEEIDWNNSRITYSINEKGQMTLDVNISKKNGERITFNGNGKALTPAETREAYALIKGHELIHEEGDKLVGDARVYFVPKFDLQNFSIERVIGPDDITLLNERLNLSLEGDSAVLKIKWDPETGYKYEINGKSFDKNTIIAAFNLVEDGDLDHDYFSDKSLKRLEDAVSVWHTAQTALKKEWQKFYDIGNAAAQYGFTVDSDWENLSTPKVLADYLNKTYGDEVKTAGIDLENLTWEEGMGWIAFFASRDANASYFNWLLEKVKNDPVVANKYNWSEFKANQDRDGLIAKYAELTNTSAQDFANSTYLAWLREQARTKLPDADVDWDNMSREEIITEFYNRTFGQGKDQGYGDAVDILISALNLTDKEFETADGMDGNVDGKATIENLISVYKNKIRNEAYEKGYQDGLQNYRIRQWMNDTTAQYLAGLNASARNDTITTWIHNADTYKEFGWEYYIIDGNSVNISGILNDPKIDNRTKNYIRSAINAGDYIIALDTVNKNGDAANGSYFQRFNAKTRTVADDGLIRPDGIFNQVKTYVNKGGE